MDVSASHDKVAWIGPRLRSAATGVMGLLSVALQRQFVRHHRFIERELDIDDLIQGYMARLVAQTRRAGTPT